MNRLYNLCFLFTIIINVFLTNAEACKGCLDLDEYNFDKIISRFDTVLVKFDVAYPYGDKHETFNTLADEVVDNKNFILAQVGIKDYGEKENDEFSKKYDINTKDDLPALRLFVRGEDEPFSFDKHLPWNNENLKTFVRDHSNIYLGLPGCLEEFDKLAIKFTTNSDKGEVLKEVEKAATKLETEREKDIAKTYVTFMKKVQEAGNSFIPQELKRLNKIITEGKINEKKKRELTNRMNVLKSFNLDLQKTEL